MSQHRRLPEKNFVLWPEDLSSDLDDAIEAFYAMARKPARVTGGIGATKPSSPKPLSRKTFNG